MLRTQILMTALLLGHNCLSRLLARLKAIRWLLKKTKSPPFEKEPYLSLGGNSER